MKFRIKQIGEVIENNDFVWKNNKGPWTKLDAKWHGQTITSAMFPIGCWDYDEYEKHRKFLEQSGIEENESKI